MAYRPLCPVYPTFPNLLNRDYCHLCISVCRRGAVTMPGLSPDRIKGFSAYQFARGTSYHIRLDKTRPKSQTLVLQGQVSVEPAKIATLWSELSGGHAMPHPLTAWEHATAVDASLAGTPYFTIRCLGNVATLAAPVIALLRTRTRQPHICSYCS